MKKTELESKHLAELHALAADAGVPKYRMLPREELIEQLANGDPAGGEASDGAEAPARRERPQRRRREGGERPARERRERPARPRREEKPKPAEQAPPEPEPDEPDTAPAPAAVQAEPAKRKRRRRRFSRRGKGLSAKDLLTPPPGRQALVYGESRAACTALLRELAAELADGSIALLVDPSPEELADWKREAPQAELVVAAQARHASDALAQAVRRAEAGEHVTLLVDSLTRLEDADAAREIYDAGLSQAKGSLTVVAALERST
jgi:Rho termination factor-like protein